MFQRHFTTLTDSRIWETENARYIDEQNYVPYLEWLAAGNEPEPASGDRFITIVNGQPTEDPNKAAILAAEAEALANPPPTVEERLAAAEAVIVELLKGG